MQIKNIRNTRCRYSGCYEKLESLEPFFTLNFSTLSVLHI